MIENAPEQSHTHGRREFLALGAVAACGLVAPGSVNAEVAPRSDKDIVLEGINELYEPAYSALESGYRRLATGHLLVSAQHRMIGCQGRMIEWWLSRIPSPNEFKRWHPKDHVSIEEMASPPPDASRTGKVSIVKQYVGGNLNVTALEARDPSEYFDDLDRLKASGVTGIASSRGKLEGMPTWGSRVIHVCRDFEWGCEMRSRFWLGPFSPVDVVPPPDVLANMVPDARAAGLLRHTLEEYTYLSAFLPEFYRQRNP